MVYTTIKKLINKKQKQTKMSKIFLKQGEVELKNGGYVSTKEGSKPVSNEAFVSAQKQAEYVCTFAEMAKGKDFLGKKADSIQDVKDEVEKKLASKKTMYVSAPTLIEQELTKKLAAEAMSFISFKEDSTKADKMNNFLQQFDTIHEYEQFGLFFEEDICKLNKIYTMEEIITAVKSTIDLLK